MKKKTKKPKNKSALETIKERRVYYFPCTSCGRKKAQSFRKHKARRALCRKCRRSAVHPDQQPLFPPGANTIAECEVVYVEPGGMVGVRPVGWDEQA